MGTFTQVRASWKLLSCRFLRTCCLTRLLSSSICASLFKSNFGPFLYAHSSRAFVLTMRTSGAQLWEPSRLDTSYFCVHLGLQSQGAPTQKPAGVGNEEGAKLSATSGFLRLYHFCLPNLVAIHADEPLRPLIARIQLTKPRCKAANVWPAARLRVGCPKRGVATVLVPEWSRRSSQRWCAHSRWSSKCKVLVLGMRNSWTFFESPYLSPTYSHKVLIRHACYACSCRSWLTFKEKTEDARWLGWTFRVCLHCTIMCVCTCIHACMIHVALHCCSLSILDSRSLSGC